MAKAGIASAASIGHWSDTSAGEGGTMEVRKSRSQYITRWWFQRFLIFHRENWGKWSNLNLTNIFFGDGLNQTTNVDFFKYHVFITFFWCLLQGQFFVVASSSGFICSSTSWGFSILTASGGSPGRIPSDCWCGFQVSLFCRNANCSNWSSSMSWEASRSTLITWWFLIVILQDVNLWVCQRFSYISGAEDDLLFT